MLPEGWHKAVAAHDASALYYRLGAGASEGVLQTAPPPNTRLQPLAAYGASPDALPDAPDHDSAGAWLQCGAVTPCGSTQVAPPRAPMPAEPVSRLNLSLACRNPHLTHRPGLARTSPMPLPAEQSASDQLPEYEPAHAKTMAALPAGSGELCESSMLLYLAPDTNCNVGYMLELFAPQVLLVPSPSLPASPRR